MGINKKRVNEFMQQVKFYRASLVKKYLRKLAKEESVLSKKIPKVKCPSCGSNRIGIECSDDYYSMDEWLHCNNCGYEFDDKVGYIDALSELKCCAYANEIALCSSFDSENVDNQEWREWCEKVILKVLKE